MIWNLSNQNLDIMGEILFKWQQKFYYPCAIHFLTNPLVRKAKLWSCFIYLCIFFGIQLF